MRDDIPNFALFLEDFYTYKGLIQNELYEDALYFEDEEEKEHCAHFYMQKVNISFWASHFKTFNTKVLSFWVKRGLSKTIEQIFFLPCVSE